MERYGNPSSVHRYGRIARRHIEEARASVAALVGVKPAQVIFTSGGTEANAMFLSGVSAATIITSAIEHDSILANSASAIRLPVLQSGIVDLDKTENILKNALRRAAVSVMMVNNETGVIQPVSEIAAIAKHYGHVMHTDAVQAAGRLAIDFASLGVNAMTLSAHKIGGPQGMGALIVDEKLVLNPLLNGGGQEMNRRPGTENVAGIVGFGVAARLAVDDLLEMPNIQIMRDSLQLELAALGCNDVSVIGCVAPRVANTLCIAIRNVPNETQVMAMDLAGVAISAGSACSSGKVRVSHVLREMHYADDIAGSALRISLGWNTTEKDVQHCADAWRTMYSRTKINSHSKAA
jgi:cysteine desulfurase